MSAEGTNQDYSRADLTASGEQFYRFFLLCIKIALCCNKNILKKDFLYLKINQIPLWK